MTRKDSNCTALGNNREMTNIYILELRVYERVHKQSRLSRVYIELFSKPEHTRVEHHLFIFRF